MATPALSGIYEIVNLVNGKRYIGSAVRIEARWSVHRHLLGKGDHHSRHLQNAWSKYGSKAFGFKIIAVCAPAELIKREQEFIDRLKPEYKTLRKAGSTLGLKWSPEARARHSVIQKANPTFKGRK